MCHKDQRFPCIRHDTAHCAWKKNRRSFSEDQARTEHLRTFGRRSTRVRNPYRKTG
ncbi:hypothetical protein CY34DRAFT_557102 [Suillus luteus UH-Slu-Lm8-n1]|uniref:Unplaced genomic scaffold CY34scaffold_451, whole genome shotgun sequence n=1 Tax=Suillus luteus UH-Slu-Lm8-n1 TaxID=930992 RepID=A0A0D0A2A7_9AGAM|nr:hypothetical protein CY34DRAFT_557102 [Suillus luteus UH-Slu-Lm8-n1]